MQVLFDIPNFSCIMQLRAENQNLVSALSNYQQILYQFFDFTQNLKQSPNIKSDRSVVAVEHKQYSYADVAQTFTERQTYNHGCKEGYERI